MRIPALALALAAATSLTGCFAGPCDPPTVTIHWELSNHLGTPNVSCGSVGTAYVDVYIANLYYRFPCTDYVGTVDVGGLAPGGYTATVEGLGPDTNGNIVIWSRDWFQVSVGDCNSNPVYTARPGEGTLELAYTYSPNVCHGGYMWYSLYDEVAGQPISSIPSSNAITNYDKTLYACGDLVQVPVPFGTYTLDWMGEVVDPLGQATPPGPNTVFQACGPLTVDVIAPAVTSLPVAMTAYVNACP